jgi:hypothetical protein
MKFCLAMFSAELFCERVIITASEPVNRLDSSADPAAIMPASTIGFISSSFQVDLGLRSRHDSQSHT